MAAVDWREQGRAVEAAKAHLNACWLAYMQGDFGTARDYLKAAGGAPETTNAYRALAAALQLQARDLEGALQTAKSVSDREEPWAGCLAAYVAGAALVGLDQPELARLSLNVGTALLDQAGDTRLMNMYVQLRQALI